MWTYLLLGLSMGLSSGISPGPLLTLVITASLRSGLPGGLAVALAPLVTDLPIIALSVFVADQMPASLLRWVGTTGGLVVIWLGVEILRSAREATVPTATISPAGPRRELWRGAAVNALNPHPYLFWATVGGPAVVRAWQTSPAYALAFVLGFYTLLIGSKTIMAWLVSQKAGTLSVHWYRRILTGCGLLMLGMGVLFIWQAWQGS
jgi:threonine/homoserine/homoserine lactone efflux protein